MNKKVQLRTDFCDELVIETHDDNSLSYEKSTYENCLITDINIKKEENILEKEIGTYITIEYDSVYDQKKRSNIIHCVKHNLLKLIDEIHKDIQKVLIVGLGNREVVSDALGPNCVNNILVTSHLYLQNKDSLLNGTRNVGALVPGVMGQTGMESAQIIQGVISIFHPDLVIVIDALATSSTKRINNAIQMNNVGIKPGSGVGNYRKELSEKTLNLPVIAMGVATVTSIGTILSEALVNLEIDKSLYEIAEYIDLDLIVTPKNMDDILHYLVEIVSEAINEALHPNYKNL